MTSNGSVIRAWISTRDDDNYNGVVDVERVTFVAKCCCGSTTERKASDMDTWLKKFLVERFGVHLERGMYRCYCLALECKECLHLSEKKRKIEFLAICKTCGKTVNITSLLTQDEKHSFLDTSGFVEEDGRLICKYPREIEICPNCVNSVN